MHIAEHHLQKDEPENKRKRRDIDAAEVWDNLADRAQRRLGDAIEKIDHHVHKLVGGVDDVKRDQPAQDRPDNDHPNIEVNSNDRDANKWIDNDHNLGSPPGGLKKREPNPRHKYKS